MVSVTCDPSVERGRRVDRERHRILKNRLYPWCVVNTGWLHEVEKRLAKWPEIGQKPLSSDPNVIGARVLGDDQEQMHYRTIFLSDIHLGTQSCKAERLIDFLERHTCDALFLVGDVIDGWQLKGTVYWPTSHNRVVRLLLDMAENGTKVKYITGNHDDMLRPYTDFRFGEVDVVDRAEHAGLDGERFVVIHGDQFDVVANHHRWLAVVGDFFYRVLLRTNGAVNVVRRFFGRDYWSLSAWTKNRVKQVVKSIGGYEKNIAAYCRNEGFDGIVCGHIHRAALTNFLGVRYINCGDWVESCTAIVEDANGEYRILDWSASRLVVDNEPEVERVAG